MSEVTEVASHSEESPSELQEQIAGAMEMFGLDPAAQTQEASEQDDATQKDEDKAPPAKEEKPASRMIKVKHNKGEVEVDASDDKLPEHLQRSLALDKERARRTELEKNLERAAKLAGYNSHAEYVADFDKIEQKSLKQQEDQFTDMMKRMREDAEANGLDPDIIEEVVRNQPEVKAAREIIERDKQKQTNDQQTEAQQQHIKEWEALFAKYPNLADSTDETGEAEWITPEIKQRIARGYSPIDAYELVNRDKLTAEAQEKARQDLLKTQRLNKRAKVEGNTPPEVEDEVPDNIKGAFAMFGLDPKSAKKFITKK